MSRVNKVLTLIGALMLFGTAHSAVVFDGFGPGDSFEVPRFVSSANTDVGIPGNPAMDRDWAAAFTPNGSNYTLDSIEIALSLVTGANEVDIYLRSSAAGVPGTLIESWHLTDQLTDAGQIFTLASFLNPLLSNGTQYWIEMSAGTNNTGVSKTGWQTSSGTASPYAQQFDEGAWISEASTSFAYRVNGTAVPLPATLMLIGAGLLGFGFQRHRESERH